MHIFITTAYIMYFYNISSFQFLADGICHFKTEHTRGMLNIHRTVILATYILAVSLCYECMHVCVLWVHACVVHACVCSSVSI